MTEDVKAKLVENEFDVEGAMQRFLNNEALYLKCLKKFLDDTNFQQLLDAKKAGNADEAFKAAHTMKGFLSNLGINKMYIPLIPVVEKLREGNMDIDEELVSLEAIYKQVYEIVQNL